MMSSDIDLGIAIAIIKLRNQIDPSLSIKKFIQTLSSDKSQVILNEGNEENVISIVEENSDDSLEDTNTNNEQEIGREKTSKRPGESEVNTSSSLKRLKTSTFETRVSKIGSQIREGDLNDDFLNMVKENRASSKVSSSTKLPKQKENYIRTGSSSFGKEPKAKNHVLNDISNSTDIRSSDIDLLTKDRNDEDLIEIDAKTTDKENGFTDIRSTNPTHKVGYKRWNRFRSKSAKNEESMKNTLLKSQPLDLKENLLSIPKSKKLSTTSLNIPKTHTKDSNGLIEITRNTNPLKRLPGGNKYLLLLSSLKLDLTALELYEYHPVTDFQIEDALDCFKTFMESEYVNEITIGVLKILGYQLSQKCLKLNKDVDELKLLVKCCFNLILYFAKKKYDDSSIRRVKYKIIENLIYQLSLKGDEKLSSDIHKHLLNQLAKSCRLFIHLSISDEELLTKKKHSYIEIYLKNRHQFQMGYKGANFRTAIKEGSQSLDSLKVVIRFQLRVLKKTKFHGDDDLKGLSSLQSFIQSSLIIMNDIQLLKSFKQIKLDWNHQYWNAI